MAIMWSSKVQASEWFGTIKRKVLETCVDTARMKENGFSLISGSSP